jgi:hypothetical protein
MSRDRKLLIYVTFIFILIISFIIFKYEFEKREAQRLKITDGVRLKTEYTTSEITDLIKLEPGYLGDSIVVYEDGTIKSMNDDLQGTIQHITNNTPDINVIEDLVRQSQLPKPVMVYRLAAHYYLTDHPDERKKLEERRRLDSLALKKAELVDSARTTVD